VVQRTSDNAREARTLGPLRNANMTIFVEGAGRPPDLDEGQSGSPGRTKPGLTAALTQRRPPDALCVPAR